MFSICHDIIIITFLFDCDDGRAFEVFKETAGCILECETTKIRLAKNTKNGFLSKNFFV